VTENNDTIQRRLTAILAADVVGYSRLMDEDEEGTLLALKEHLQQFIEPAIDSHNGHIIKLMGDGILAEFTSVHDAVQSAIDIQRGMFRRNSKLLDEHKIVFRIGINIGDVISEDDDVFGTDVNIAARLETLAEPGGICLSRPVYDQVKHLIDVGFTYLGEQQVKNISDPVYAYKIDLYNVKAGSDDKAISTKELFIKYRHIVAVLILGGIVVAGSIFYFHESDGTGSLKGKAAATAEPLPPPVTTPIVVSPPPSGSLSPGVSFRDCSVCPEMVVVPSGKFIMGSKKGDADEQPVLEVTIPKELAIGKYEVTFDEWEACVEGGGCNAYRPKDNGWGQGQQPVINVSWEDSKSYVMWISGRTGKAYRLLTEAEWEYIARAGSESMYPWGPVIDPSKANYGNFKARTIPVGRYNPNAFGLYDVIGNASEWTEDCYHRDAYQTHRSYPSPVESQDLTCSRVLRGSSWDIDTSDGINLMRTSIRRSGKPDGRYSHYGLRVARAID